MTIVFVLNHIYLHGGIEKVTSVKANYFAGLPNVRVIILTHSQNGQEPIYPLDPRIELMDLEINYNQDISPFAPENAKKFRTHFKREKILFKSLKPDVIISPHYNIDHYWLPLIKGKATLIKERHSSYYGAQKNLSFPQKLKDKLTHFANAKYDHFLVLNRDEKSHVDYKNTQIFPNPIALSEAKAELKNKKIIAAGRLAPVKRFDELIKIWSIIEKDYPDWELHIYGEDYLNTKEKLISLIKELNLEASVKIKESVSNIMEVMKEYSGLAMTSETEAFPMILLEALSLGVPIISYDCPYGPRNIVKNGEDGLIVENNNREEFAEALRKFMGDDDFRKKLGDNAKENIRRFSIESVMKDWKNLLNIN